MKYLYQELKKDDGIILRGVVNLPDDFDQAKKYKSIIFFHGLSGDRNGTKWFRITNAKYLCDRGYVVIRFDFSGSGESDGSFYDMTLTRELDEARLIVEFVKNLDYIDQKEISWYGHSLGGLISCLLAKELSPKSLILLAPASDITNPDYIIDKKIALERILGRNIDYKNEENRKALLERIPIEEYDFGGVKIHKNFFVDLLQYDAYQKACLYDKNVLIIRGDSDDLVDRESNKKLADTFKNSLYIEIKNTDHSFTNEDARDQVYNIMYEFLEKE